jgi:hypothetical protein
MEEKIIGGVKTTFPISEEQTLKQIKQWIFNLLIKKEIEKQMEELKQQEQASA